MYYELCGENMQLLRRRKSGKTRIDAILAKYEGVKGALIPILQEVQSLYNYLPKDALEYVAAQTGTPIAQIYGVVTFYSQFHLNPRGRNIIRVCQGTACHVRGGKTILQALEKNLTLKQGIQLTTCALRWKRLPASARAAWPLLCRLTKIPTAG